MNKLLIVLFAVCLISVHAFVKRDAPEDATKPDILEDIKKKATDTFNKALEAVKEIDTDKYINDLNNVVESAKQKVQEYIKTTESKSETDH